jgi:uncharacterized protein (DUF1778 family)
VDKHITFPLRLPRDLHEFLHKAAFVTGKSKHQYCLDAIRKEAVQDAKGVQVSSVPNRIAEGETE